jgi:hypothetical protein
VTAKATQVQLPCSNNSHWALSNSK